MKIRKWAGALLLCLLAATLFAAGAFAYDPVDTGRSMSLTVDFHFGEEAIPGTSFRLYHVAEADEDLRFTLTPQFEGYAVRTEGRTVEEWNSLAQTLAGYAALDGLVPAYEGVTDEEGRWAVGEDLRAGLYLLTGETAVIGGFAYKPIPTIILLPQLGADGHWNYENNTVEPKSERSGTEDTVTRKVLKVWKDAGLEHERPDSVTVALLRDGTEVESVVLDAENYWRYSWEDLSAEYQWTVIEKDVPAGYLTEASRNGVTIVITNIAAPCIGDPPVKKVISGDTPPNDALFRFRMEAVSNTAGYPVTEQPMPPNAVDGVVRVEIRGELEFEFGDILFMRPGVYRYRVVEEYTEQPNYTYDLTVYEVTYTVTETSGRLSLIREFSADRREAASIVFNNKYTDPNGPTPVDPDPDKPDPVKPEPVEPKPDEPEPVEPKPDQPEPERPTPEQPGPNGPDPVIPPPEDEPTPVLPQTGQLWWPVPVLAILGVAFLIVGLIRRGGHRDEV